MKHFFLPISYIHLKQAASTGTVTLLRIDLSNIEKGKEKETIFKWVLCIVWGLFNLFAGSAGSGDEAVLQILAPAPLKTLLNWHFH